MDDLKIGIFWLIDDHYKFNFNMKILYIFFVCIIILLLIIIELCEIKKSMKQKHKNAKTKIN